jgi:hypothetical protein
MAYEIGVQVGVEDIGGLTFGEDEARLRKKETGHTVGSDDERRKVVGYWGVGRGRVDGVDRCHGFVVVLVKGVQGALAVTGHDSHGSGRLDLPIASYRIASLVLSVMKSIKKSLVPFYSSLSLYFSFPTSASGQRFKFFKK